MSKEQKPNPPGYAQAPYPMQSQSSAQPFHDRNVQGMPPPPPTYEQAMSHPTPGQYVPQQTGYPSAPPPPGYYSAPGPYGQPGYAPPMYGHAPQYNQPAFVQHVPSTVVVTNAFDAGSRFDGISQPRIPPPPPGIMPNAAQMAAQQGQNVVLGQKPASWFAGGSSGGTTFW